MTLDNCMFNPVFTNIEFPKTIKNRLFRNTKKAAILGIFPTHVK